MCLAWDMKIRSGQKLVILALADAANDEGFCYPGYERLMRKTGLAKASLAKNLKALEAMGVFTKKPHAEIGKGRKVNTYQLHLETMKSMTYELIAERAKSSPCEPTEESPISSLYDKFKNDTRKVQKRPPISSTGEHEQSVLTVSKEQSVNTKGNPSSSTALAVIADRQKTFAMHLGWQPRKDLVERCQAAGIDLPKIPPPRAAEIIGEFRSYWSGETKLLNEDKWQHKFFQNLKALQGRGTLYTEAKAVRSSRDHSLEEDLHDTSWAQ